MERTITLENVELSDIHDRPELITSLLYKKLLQKIDESLESIPQRRYAEANKALQLCSDIMTRLGFGIKYEAGVIADQLEVLYHYIQDKLLEANIKKDVNILHELREIIQQLDAAWLEAMNNAKESTVTKAEFTLTNKPSARINPYQKREIEQELYEYEKENQEVHLKK
jgi:flagellar protein FliS